ncbi:molybdopterin-dependent oxidoreductase [Aurantimonas sp. HBX-1]|uniref:molybdopterin-dependent oxidoreductase n=1 Tax=Aurantimonas sp. HBX-1 TaxID=2906072 RepID=UPI001F2F3024|nr:molybdopterin-dependent oxidoreductase [Aurantimonas sp. HBX-1]UIJ74140.1 molybdopterin-dependent oxidoreductase [Aurantimonas sp. HBX-1]
MLTTAQADPLAAPAGEPILIVSGKIASTNVGDTAQFDRAMLEALGTVSFETRTPWREGISTFEGVPLEALMTAVGARGETVTAIALNDYVTSIPISDFARFGTILALKWDGEYMTVRDHGPLFIVYPYDSDPELQNQTYFGRSAWQLRQLVVE